MPHKRSKSKKRANSGKSEVPPTALSYRGPVIDKRSKAQVDTSTVVMSYVGTLASTGGGVINASYGSSPASAADWSSLSASWEEYRVLAWEVIFRPSNRYSKTTTVTMPIITVIDRASSTALASYTQAVGHESCEFGDLDDPFHKILKMQGVDEANFIVTTAPVSSSWLKLYADTLSISTVYGLIVIRYRVQFRGRA